MTHQPVKNQKNLGYPVTTRLISWEQRVRETEGSRWNLPTAIYFFGDGDQIVFVQYNLAVTGPEPV